MEDLPVVRIGATVVNPSVFARFDKWVAEVYLPMFIKHRECLHIDRYLIARETPGYAVSMNLSYWESVSSFKNVIQEPDIVDVRKDMRTTWIDRYGGETIWDGMYFMARSFISDTAKVPEGNMGMGVENAPVIHIIAFDPSPQQEAKYGDWLTRTGYQVYLPLFLTVPGLKRVDCLKHTEETAFFHGQELAKIYPLYAFVFHFESLKVSEEFDRSAAMAAFQEGIKTNFPAGLRLKWDVQYQLTRSWRK